MSEFEDIESKWQKRWDEAHLFEPSPDQRKKYFATFPYGYMNGTPHIGHAFTFLRVEFLCRYKRMRGYNVLFPFAFHCTGLPIVAAAKRIASGDRKQLEILESMGIDEKEVNRFADPVYWTEYFPRRWENSMRRLGMSIDWRRKFITTSLEPNYDAFVRWQFTKLKEGDYVRKGSHPVIWCPKDNIPVGDHDRSEGEGVVPTEYTLLKFELSGRYLVAATLRPETAFGQTNLWINPGADYVTASVNGEKWVISREAAQKLSEQGKHVAILEQVSPSSLIGVKAHSPTMGHGIPVFPASFPDPDRGTGIVVSVPSDSPDDLIALEELRRKAQSGELEGKLAEEVLKTHPVRTIETPGFGMEPAAYALKKYGISGQHETEKLRNAREEVYREGYYRGIMRNVPEEYRDMGVTEAREKIREQLRSSGWADTMYEPSDRVVCRCMTKCIVKVVSDQWFLAYGDARWKSKAHEAVREMSFYPETLRKQFDNVIDWLRDWACVHHTGLGTSLPWEPQWKIESLSDSTIYMAYYTVSHHIRLMKSPPSLGVFDYIFLGHGDAKGIASAEGIDAGLLEEMRQEFLYWYPMDMRISGKDLVGNHLTFSLFNHTAIFPHGLWPRAFAVNGFMKLGGSKMSKSKGNILLLDDALAKFGADVTRMTEAYADEGFDDPNWDDDFASNCHNRLKQMLDTASSVEQMQDGHHGADAWLVASTNQLYSEYIECMEKLEFKNAMRHAVLDMQNIYRWYLRRTEGRPNRKAVRHFIEMQALMAAPFVPHICEEMWERLGHSGFISTALLPDPGTMQVSREPLLLEEYLRDVIGDIEDLLRIKQGGSVYLYAAASWKSELLDAELNGNAERKEHIRAKVSHDDIATFYRRMAMEKKQGRLSFRAEVAKHCRELEFLKSSAKFISSAVGVPVTVMGEEDAGPGKERKQSSFPGRPAIYIERAGS